MRKNNLPKSAQFKPGQTGNPNGRPKKLPGLDELLGDIPESDYQAIIGALIKKAKRGDVRCAEVILDRAYGKAKQFIDMNQKGDLQMIFGSQIDYTKLSQAALKEVLAASN